MRLPARLFRVDALVGYGWPDVYEQREEHRTFATAQQAADWCDRLGAFPSHHLVLCIHTTDTNWRPVQVGELPEPRTVA